MSRQRFNVYGNDAHKSYPVSVAASTDNVSVGAATNQAATVALSAQTSGATTQGSWVISQAFWSYGTTAVGRFTVADSSGTLFDTDLHTGGGQNFGVITFIPPLASQVQNSALTATLGAAAGATGKLTLQAWLEL